MTRVSVGASKDSKLIAISKGPSFNYTSHKKNAVAGYTLIQPIDNAINTVAHTTFNGQPAYVLEQTTQPTCMGDEAGIGGGIKSGTIGTEVKPTSGASNIFIGGKALIREGDTCTMNNMNVEGVYITVDASWVDAAIAQAEEDAGLWASPPIIERNPDGSLNNTPPSSPLSANKKLTRPADSIEMYHHYLFGKGEALTLDNLGTTQLLKDAVIKEGAFKKEGSIQSRFIEQIRDEFKKGENDYTFNGSYNVGKEIDIWAYGSSVISGQFYGNIEENPQGDVKVSGKINYLYTDRFEDPYDTFDWVEGSWDPSGTPYDISGEWTNYINTTIKK